MKKIVGIGIACLLIAGLACGKAVAWYHAGARGTASGGDGSWSAHGYRGGSASGGDGSWSGTGYRGGTASGGDGSWHATGAGGTTASGGYDHYYGGTYTTYHPPVVVNSYYGSGCYDCGGWNTAGAVAAGVAVGAVAGAAVASAAAKNQYAMGAVYTTMPSSCVYSPAHGQAYYFCSGTWFTPFYGANGVTYRVVPAPS